MNDECVVESGGNYTMKMNKTWRGIDGVMDWNV